MSREEALNAITAFVENYACGSDLEGLRDAIEALHEPRPHGEWIEKHCDYGVYYRCSNCHKMPPNYECDYKEGAIRTNFCPNCGADMREGDSDA